MISFFLLFLLFLSFFFKFASILIYLSSFLPSFLFLSFSFSLPLCSKINKINILDFLNLHLTVVLLNEFLSNILQKLCFSVAEISLAHKVLDQLNHIVTGLSLTWNKLKKANKTGVRSILKEKKTRKLVGIFLMKDFNQFSDWSLV